MKKNRPNSSGEAPEEAAIPRAPRLSEIREPAVTTEVGEAAASEASAQKRTEARKPRKLPKKVEADLQAFCELVATAEKWDWQRILLEHYTEFVPYPVSKLEIYLQLYDWAGSEGQAQAYLFEKNPGLPLLNEWDDNPRRIEKWISRLIDYGAYPGYRALMDELLAYAFSRPDFSISQDTLVMLLYDYEGLDRDWFKKQTLRIRGRIDRDFYEEYYNELPEPPPLEEAQAELARLAAAGDGKPALPPPVQLLLARFAAEDEEDDYYDEDEDEDEEDESENTALDETDDDTFDIDAEEEDEEEAAEELAGAIVLGAVAYHYYEKHKHHEELEALEKEHQDHTYTRYRSDYPDGDLDGAGYESEDSFEQEL